MALMSPTDSMFLIGESREQPMHVGSLQVFELPDGADTDLLRTALLDMLQQTDVSPLFRRRPYRSLTTLGQWGWTDDVDVDLEHHVRHSALPQPGRVRELLALVSRLHSTLLDRQRPLWEVHLIEGLEGNRFAVYSKLHHAVMDGVSGMRLLQRALSKTPDEDQPAFWTLGPRRSSSGTRKPRRNPLLALPRATIDAVADMVALTPRMLRLGDQALRAQAAGVMLPMADNSHTGMYRFGTLPFNIVISNVPGPRESLYLHGSRLSGLYPLSIPVNGQAVNITATSYTDGMGIGLTACRRSVPSVQRMLTGLETSLDELADVVNRPDTPIRSTPGMRAAA